jgi:hypothetical protein
MLRAAVAARSPGTKQQSCLAQASVVMHERPQQKTKGACGKMGQAALSAYKPIPNPSQRLASRHSHRCQNAYAAAAGFQNMA